MRRKRFHPDARLHSPRLTLRTLKRPHGRQAPRLKPWFKQSRGLSVFRFPGTESLLTSRYSRLTSDAFLLLVPPIFIVAAKRRDNTSMRCWAWLLAAILVAPGGSTSPPVHCREMECFGGVTVAPEAVSRSNTKHTRYVGTFSHVTECEEACFKYRV